MKNMRLILTLFVLAFSLSAMAKPRTVLCQGPVKAQQLNKKLVDQGVAQVKFQLVDGSTIKDILVRSKFKKIKAQSIDAYQSIAVKRAVASGRYKADFFNIGHNGACQIAMGYQGDLAKSASPKASWGVFMMDCGAYAVTGNLKCQMR